VSIGAPPGVKRAPTTILRPPRDSSQIRLKFVPSNTTTGCPWSMPGRGTAKPIVAGFGGSKGRLSERPQRTLRAAEPNRSSTHAIIQRPPPSACAGSVWFGVSNAMTNGEPGGLPTTRPSRSDSPDAGSDQETMGPDAAPPKQPSPTIGTEFEMITVDPV